MAKRKRASGPRRRFPRVRRYGRRLKRRFSKAKVPFEVLIGAATIPFTPAQSGCMTPLEALQAGNMTELVSQMKSGFLGVDIFGSSGGGPDVMRMLNPFDMERGRYTKTLIYAGLIGMVRRKITGRYTTPLFKKIPLIGRIVN